MKTFLAILLILSQALYAATGDIDSDGLRDEVETSTGIYVSPSNTGTNPSVADSDDDSVPDGLEINHETNPTDATSRKSRPNIILINCDDLGYGDIGCFWQNQKTGTQKFATPGLDAMAAQGTMLTQHYASAPICASSRGSLMQGRHQGHCDIRDKQFDKPLPNNHSIASVLMLAGYRTIHIGKAGLAGGLTGIPQSSVAIAAHPLARGFNRFFGTLSHYHGQNHYPQNGNILPYGAIYNDYSKVTDAYVDLYSTDVYTAFAKKTIIGETQTHPARPFFLYLAYTAPHFDNAVPPTREYPSGSGLTGGIQWTGPPSYVNTATNDPLKINNIANQHPSVNPVWPQYAREYVSMIRRLDDSVADILQTLRDLAIDDNTLVVLTSDNGPDNSQINPAFFQSFANFEGLKGEILEGGIREPTIAWWPGKIIGSNNVNNIKLCTKPSVQYDWLATFAEVAGIACPSYSDGVSILPSLTGEGTQRDKGYLYFEWDNPRGYTSNIYGFTNHQNELMNQCQSIRIGNYAGLRLNISSPSDNFRIYNVVSDTKQAIDLASTMPALHAQMKNIAISARRPGGGVTRPYDTARLPAVNPSPVTSGVKYQNYEGYWPWIPEFRDLTAVSSGLTANITPSVRSRNNDVGISFTGYVSVPTSGTYTFATSSNAATSLWIHDGHVIDNDFNFVTNKSSDPVYLEAGMHPIRLYYHHQGGSLSLSLSYSGPGIPMQPIPDSAFFTDGPSPLFNLQPDSLVTRMNSSILVDALANDSGNYPLSLSHAGLLASGNASIYAGKILFTPASDFLGSLKFPYWVSGGNSSADSIVTATVLFDEEIWIPFDEGTGSSIEFVSPALTGTGVLLGTQTPDLSWSYGKANKCISFDGNDDQANFAGLTLLGGSTPRTFCCWLKSGATVSNEIQTLFSYGGPTPGGLFAVRVNNTPGITGAFPARLEVQNGTIIGTQPLNDGQWHHLAIVLSDTNGDSIINVAEARIFVDGVPDPISTTIPQAINTGNTLTPCAGGSNHATNHNFMGSLDDVRVFSRALSDLEIAKLGSPVAILPPDNMDTDNDGASDLREYVAGTNPNDPKSLFSILKTSKSANAIKLEWDGVSGRTYRVEQSSNMINWSLVPEIPPIVVDSSMPGISVTVPDNGASTRFLRLQVMLTP